MDFWSCNCHDTTRSKGLRGREKIWDKLDKIKLDSPVRVGTLLQGFLFVEIKSQCIKSLELNEAVSASNI